MDIRIIFARAAMVLGFVAMVAGIIWWFAYYSQWQGAFGLLDVKIGCLFMKTSECRLFQDFIGSSYIVPYQPGIFLGGLIMVVSSFVMLFGKR